MTVVKASLMGAIGGAAVMAGLAAVLMAQDSGPAPQCTMCPAYYINNSEIQEYVAKAMKERLVDQQIRDVEIGKAHVGVGVVYRGKLDKPGPNSVAEHDLVSEVYHIIEGTATFVTGPDLVGKTRRPATLETVRLFNGPGNGAASIRNGVTHQLKPGDVMVIPAGTGHWFKKIDDHITYLIVRFDPDRATPLKDEAASRVWLQTPHAPSN